MLQYGQVCPTFGQANKQKNRKDRGWKILMGYLARNAGTMQWGEEILT
jgi:hypothetical protein